jgi:hypothetical protein
MSYRTLLYDIGYYFQFQSARNHKITSAKSSVTNFEKICKIAEHLWRRFDYFFALSVMFGFQNFQKLGILPFLFGGEKL